MDHLDTALTFSHAHSSTMNPQSLSRSVLVFACFVISSAIGAGQNPPPFQKLPFAHDSGRIVNRGGGLEVVISFQVQVQGAEWLRLYFSEVELAGSLETADASILRITSYADGGTQEMSAEHVRQWQQSSAYFNGNAVQVEVLAQPGTGFNRVVLDTVDVGSIPVGPDTQCGPTDNRTPSNDPRTCRAMPVGCTAWIIEDCAHCFLSAGHCCCSSLQVMEFNVPPSLANGTLVHPPPSDQYAVDASSRQSQFIGLGADWAYFGCHPNSTTGMTPIQAQGSAYVLAAPPPFNPSHVIRITGYGVDSTPNGTFNQIQQTSTGPYFSFSGTTVQYQCDTEGGNSGSAIQWENGNGVAIGIHTNGGCSTSGSGANSGCGINNASLQNALNNPLGVCRVLSNATTYCTAKVNSLGCIPTLVNVGTPSIGGSFSIQANQVLNSKSGILFYGFASAAIPFGGGTLCVASPIERTPVQDSGGSSTGNDCTGTYSFDMGALIAAGTDPGLVCGRTVFAQFWSRDPGFNPPNNVGFTDASRFVIGP